MSTKLQLWRSSCQLRDGADALGLTIAWSHVARPPSFKYEAIKVENEVSKRLYGATSRRLSVAGFISLISVYLAGCERDATTPSNVVAEGENTSDFEFPLVHGQDGTPDGRRALRLDSSKGTLEIAYVDGPVATNKATVKVGMQPTSVRAASNSEAWVVDPIANSICIVNLDSATVTYVFQTSLQPTDVQFFGSPSRAYVTGAQGRELLVFDPAAPGKPLARIALQLASQRTAADDI